MTSKRKLGIATISSLVLFILLYKAGIELKHREVAFVGELFIWISHALKIVFLLMIFWQYGKLFKCPSILCKVLLSIGAIPFIMVSCTTTMMSGRMILNASRPINPQRLINKKSMLNDLSSLADEMIAQQRVFWVGNGFDNFVFSIRYSDGSYNFSSNSFSDEFDFNKPALAEDMSKVRHYDLPFVDGSLKPDNKKLVDPNEYSFSKRASRIIRKYGFDNIKLYPEHKVVQYQIYDFIGWDAGSYYVYYYCPNSNLPNDFVYSKMLNSEWYFIRKPRFNE